MIVDNLLLRDLTITAFISISHVILLYIIVGHMLLVFFILLANARAMLREPAILWT
jgi:hypothetical protein